MKGLLAFGVTNRFYLKGLSRFSLQLSSHFLYNYQTTITFTFDDHFHWSKPLAITLVSKDCSNLPLRHLPRHSVLLDCKASSTFNKEPPTVIIIYGLLFLHFAFFRMGFRIRNKDNVQTSGIGKFLLENKRENEEKKEKTKTVEGTKMVWACNFQKWQGAY